MCHNKSSAPPTPAHISIQQNRTPGTDPVPYLHASSDTGSGDTIVLLTDIFGVTPFYRHLAAMLAEKGHDVVIPDVFHRVGHATDPGRDAALARRRQLDDRLAIEDIERTVAHTVDDQQTFGVLGFCLGGSFALLTAAAHPNQVTATYYAFPKGAPGAKVPVKPPLEAADAIDGPVLCHWGRDDYIDHEEIDQLEQILASAPGPSEIRWYDNAGHSFLAGLTEPNHPSTAAAHDSWQRTVEFFERYLTVGSAN
ncbi:Carboxymethylenebutenolidase (plasmid) [Rhodococcus opacus]|uniref:Carboxymethylenebutenolidase n=2 Tax=Rhodococcus opacus TaxID=37919 RepID=CLCD_RHOOP|nr:dienelactone hydrolase family protein [Rhodococcus opacus]O67988.1 RecName: Full=Carboxymethylenebutenolidase; AltName: Full=Dienelactone hydrolase; Short=DLH [Rhodococcus opacus]AAC38252.1 dienelactone hydrolase [Rhodococcus opacus]ANS32244.1 Carboxymethylenebutenolidase, dienelactone hydrolase [Rhodococcus opacus]ANS32338.1 Carboxymethylenebutenolidase [Rhodococcus opacus]